MLGNEDCLNETHTIQTYTLHRFTSVYFDTRETLPNFVNTDHILLPDISITFEPDYYNKIPISIENIPIELQGKEVKTFLSTYTIPIGKTYYPRTKHYNKYFTTEARAYQCIKLNQHIPRHINHFGRYLRIWYDEQPKDKPNDADTNINQLLITSLFLYNPTIQWYNPRFTSTIQSKIKTHIIPNVTPTPHPHDTPNIQIKMQEETQDEIIQQQTQKEKQWEYISPTNRSINS